MSSYLMNKAQLMDELTMLLLDGGGRFKLENNQLTHKHCLLVELEDDGLCRCFVFLSREDSVKAISNSAFQNVLSQLDGTEYLISMFRRKD